MSKWTFVTNHAVVLTHLAKHPCITARQLALEIGITERAVRTIIADLESERYIEKAKEGLAPAPFNSVGQAGRAIVDAPRVGRKTGLEAIP